MRTEERYRGILNPDVRGGLRKTGEEKSFSRNDTAKHHTCESTFRFSMEKTNRNASRIDFALNRELGSKVKKTNKPWWEEHWMGSLETQIAFLALLVTGYVTWDCHTTSLCPGVLPLKNKELGLTSKVPQTLTSEDSVSRGIFMHFVYYTRKCSE